MHDGEIIKWLMEGDVSIRYQASRDLLDRDDTGLQNRIEKEGWGRQYLDARKGKPHWGMGFYQPKWTSSHYTLLDLRNLCLSPTCPEVRETLGLISRMKGPDGGIHTGGTHTKSDVCINGMALNYFCWFRWSENDLESVVDFILSQYMADGGFNCMSNRSGAVHSSLHTTLSVLEGIYEFKRNGYTYRLGDLETVEKSSREFILEHRLYKSDKTGEIIRNEFLRFPYPPRWKYDILKALDYFQFSGMEYDPRMQDALDVLISKRNPKGSWKLNAKYPGAAHFEMEKAGKPSHWNTLRAMRVLKKYQSSLQ